jgi:serine/threonine-protein kinase
VESLTSLRNRPFRLGECLVHPDTDRVDRDGRTLSLQPRLMHLLTFLAEHSGEVVSRERILDEVWKKEFVSDGTLRHAVAVLRQALGDDAHHPRYIETISTKGYRLVATVAEIGDVPLHDVDAGKTRRRRFGRLVLVAAAAACLVALLIVLRPLHGRRADSLFSRKPPSVAVLPFENLGSAEDESFAAGLTEEIATGLSALRGLTVVSGARALGAARSNMSAKQLGEQMGADFLLEGSVRWVRDDTGQLRIRVTPRLIRVADDTRVWSAAYDRVLGDIFEVQSEIARQVAERLHGSMFDAKPAAKGVPITREAGAYEAFLRGRAYATARETTQDMNLAVSMFQRALELDPDFAIASAELAKAHARLYHTGGDRSGRRLVMARRAAERALELAPSDPRVNLAVGYYHYWALRDYERALTLLETAERSLPNDPEVLEGLGFILRRHGALEQALERQLRAFEASPLDALVAVEIGNTLRGLARYQEAEEFFDRALALAPDLVSAYVWKAENYWLWAGATAPARATLERMPDVAVPHALEARYMQELYDGRLDQAASLLAETDLEVLAYQERFYPKALLEAEVLGLRGDAVAAGTAYGRAREILEAVREERPDDARVHAALGVAYAGLGRKDDAVRSGRLAVQLFPVTADTWSGPDYVRELARVYVMVGAHDLAVDQLVSLLSVPNRWVSPQLLRLDPRWRPLRGDPRFEALLAQPAAAQ